MLSFTDSKIKLPESFLLILYIFQIMIKKKKKKESAKVP